jgi:CzcA family heavy metal efflux pump
MLKTIVAFSIRFRGVVIALACALVGYGIFSLTQARFDVFPEFSPPEVVIATEAPGLVPEQVEVLVTQPIENSVMGAPGVSSVRSGSIEGLSLITVVFDSGRDVYRDRQVLGERLAALVGQLPADVHPVMEPLTSSTSTVSVLGLTSPTKSLMEITTVADWTVKPRLLAVPGVAKVAVFGEEAREIQLQFNSQKLIQYGLAVSDVIAAAKQATGVKGAGFISTGNQRVLLKTEGQSLTPSLMVQAVLLHHNGVNVTLGDVCRVVDAPAPRVGGASVMGRPGLVLVVSSQYGANTLEVTRGLDRALAELRPSLAAEGIVLHADIFRPADFIQTALHNIDVSLAIGAALIVIVLFLFLFNFRTAAVSCAAIPLSLLAAVVVLGKLGQSLNTMTLGGLAIAIGEVVDDAVIDVENIFRRLRENCTASAPRSAFRVVLDASIEVRSAVVYATFAVILVFFPVLTLPGVAGRIFSPLGEAYIWAILASLGVALTLTPALTFLLLADRDLRPREPPVVRILKAGYRRILLGVERVPALVMGAVALLIALGAFSVPQLESSFLPELREGNLTVHMTAVPGTSVGASLRMGQQVTQALLKIPAVREVAQRVGRAELSDDNAGTHSSEFEVKFKSLSGRQVAQAQAQVRRTLARLGGAAFSANTFLTERINEVLSGYTAPFVVNIFGNDLDTLNAEARQVAAVLNKIPGASEVQIQSAPSVPQVVVRLRPEAVAYWGFDPVQVLDAVRTAYSGDVVGQIYDGNRVFNVAVILPANARRRPVDIGSLILRSPGGQFVRLRDLAMVNAGSGRYVVLHQGARRLQTVTCNIERRDLASFMSEARRRISALPLRTGSYVEYAGTAVAQAESRRTLLLHSLLAALGMLLLLSVVLGSFPNLLLVLLNLPFALVGGVLAAYFTGRDLSLGSLVGFVTLFGITLRNSIMLISHYEHLVDVEGMSWNLDAALRGASERLTPILMTALVTGLGLLPLALGSGDPGREIEGPMAIVILGGLVTSTALNLLVLPTLALRYGRFQRPAGEAC